MNFVKLNKLAEAGDSQAESRNRQWVNFRWWSPKRYYQYAKIKNQPLEEKTVGGVEKGTCNPVEQEENSQKRLHASRGQQTKWEISINILLHF